MKKLFPYNRYYELTLNLNPFTWFSKPRWYRFDWQRSQSLNREGQLDLFLFRINWFRTLKDF